MNTSGSPLAARQNSFVYVFIGIFLIFCVIAVVVFLIIRKYKKITKSSAWIEANKNRETKLSDIKMLAHEANFTKQEMIRLWHMCRRYHTKNIYFLYREESEVNQLFRTEFQRLNEQVPRNEEKIALLYEVRYKIEKLVDRTHSILSTKSLHIGQIVTIIGDKKIQWNAKVSKNTQNEIHLEIPPEMEQSQSKPKPLSKFILTFPAQTGILYKCIVRAVRYEKLPNGKVYLLTGHSPTMKIVQNRMTKRQNVNRECQFSAVKFSGNEQKRKFEVQPKKYNGALIDISATGCKLACGLPIVQGQYIQVYFSMPGMDKSEAQGVIVKTKKDSDEKTFLLYIKFTDIDISVKNNIYTCIYDYF